MIYPVIVSGHRRSGTHLLSDIIENNFGYMRVFFDLDNFCDGNFTDDDIDRFEKSLRNDKILLWTHKERKDQLKCSEKLPEKVREIVDDFINRSKIAYIFRDGRDVMTSYYHMKKPNHDIGTFNNYSAPGWEKNILGWIKEEDILKVRYEDIITKYYIIFQRIGKFLEDDSCEDNPVDLRLKSKDDQNPNLKYSHREFRKGIIGDYKNEFTEKDIKIFNKKYGNILRKLDYEVEI